MSTRNRRLSFAAAALALLSIAAAPLALRARAGDEDGGKVFGTPRAEIFQESRTGGPLVEGDAVTYLPHIAELQPGNRTHNVRLDIVTVDRHASMLR